jgi:hypothetical protein
MSGGFTPVKGTAGAAPNTIFFGYVPDRFNMLWPYHFTNVPAAVQETGLNQANLASQWTIYNTSYQGGANANTVSFGSSALAPDTTNNAVHLTEAATTSVHKIEAGYTMALMQQSAFAASPGFNVRFAVFAKAAGRTRIALYVWLVGQPPGNYGKVVFDLAGGQVAVAPSSAGANWSAGNASIVAWPGGWFLCRFDVTTATNFFAGVPHIIAHGIYIDNGSGLAAESTNYAGNGLSGVYIWRTNALPPGAWNMSGQRIFFDDFTSPTTVDVNSTYQPGFNIYPLQQSPLNATPFPGNSGEHGFNFYLGAGPSLDATCITVANSLMTISLPGTFATGGGALGTVMPVGGYPPVQKYDVVTDSAIGAPQSWSGFTYGPPYLLEFSVAYGYDVHTGANAGGVIWCDSAQLHTQHFYYNDPSQIISWITPGNASGPLAAFSTEIDYFEVPSLIPGWSAGGFTAIHAYPGGFAGYQSVSIVQPDPVVGGILADTYGVPTWSTNLGYSGAAYPPGGQQVYYIPDGNIYSCIVSPPSTPAPSPPSDPTHWRLLGTPASQKSVVVNLNNQNVHHILHVPYTPQDGVGQILIFMNGFYIQGAQEAQWIYGPSLTGATTEDAGRIYHNMVDDYNKCSLFLVMGWSQHTNGSAAEFCSYDWISMRK